jgi:hypothetical protein
MTATRSAIRAATPRSSVTKIQSHAKLLVRPPEKDQPRISVRRRSSSASVSYSATRRRPVTTARFGGSTRIKARIVADLAEPDSPMMQSTSRVRRNGLNRPG